MALQRGVRVDRLLVPRRAVVVELWRRVAELRLATAPWWGGGGKWLLRELAALDAATGTAYAPRLHDALPRALAGDADLLVALADEVLDRVGGRLWAGYTSAADLPEES